MIKVLYINRESGGIKISQRIYMQYIQFSFIYTEDIFDKPKEIFGLSFSSQFYIVKIEKKGGCGEKRFCYVNKLMFTRNGLKT